MKLVCSLPSLDLLNEISSFVDGILLKDNADILEEIHQVKKLNLLPIYSLSEMVFPMELEVYKQKILLTSPTDCLYYITDLGLAHILKELGLIERTIFDPITMITNSLDAKAYMEYGFHSLGLSNEITLKDIERIISKSNCKAFVQVFGYRIMLSTRRTLLSLYQDKIKTKFPLENLTIQEATRNDFFPIEETLQGTKIYRSQLICLLKELEPLPLEFAYIDSYRLDKDIFKEVVKLFSLIKSKEHKEEALKELEALNLPIGEGFAYKDSVYMKEEF
ncbi:MAG: U32 family peptidase [Anaeroplasmataceae bacterium]|nr:U32 family peptidase [Anaeroplasmataceae bacterium]